MGLVPWSSRLTITPETGCPPAFLAITRRLYGPAGETVVVTGLVTVMFAGTICAAVEVETTQDSS